VGKITSALLGNFTSALTGKPVRKWVKAQIVRIEKPFNAFWTRRHARLAQKSSVKGAA
jgi:hypothetical protein